MKQQDTDFITVTRLRGAIDASTRYLDTRLAEEKSDLSDQLSKQANYLNKSIIDECAYINHRISHVADKQAIYGETVETIAKIVDSTQTVLKFTLLLGILNLILAFSILCGI